MFPQCEMLKGEQLKRIILLVQRRIISMKKKGEISKHESTGAGRFLLSSD